MPPPGSTQGQVQPYTSPNGTTQPGSQFDTTSAALAQAASTGGPQPTVTNNQLAQGASQTAQTITNAETPQFRQSYVNNSNLPNMNSNYSDLADQLAQYDKNVMAPNYTPITPNPDATSGRVVAPSPLELTLSALNSPTFSFTNPTMGIQSQTAQKNNIADLMSYLNTAIGKELTSREGTYASSVGGAKDYLKTLMDTLSQREQNQTQLEMKGMELEIQKAQLQRERESKFGDYANTVLNDLLAGKFSTSGNPQDAWGQAFQKVKAQFPDFSDDEINSALGGSAGYDSSTKTFTGQNTGNATPASLQSIAYNNKLSSPQLQAQNLSSTIDSTLSAFNNTSFLGKISPKLAGGNADATTLQNNKDLLLSQVDQMSTKRYNQTKFKQLVNDFFNPFQTPQQAGQSAQALKTFLSTETGIDLSTTSNQSSGNSIQIGRFQVTPH